MGACLDLVGAGGIAAVTAESVSTAAKLTKRYFYESFADREAILLAALEELFVELITAIRAARDAAREGDRAEPITEAFVATLCADPRRARLYAECGVLPALCARRESAIVAFTDLVSGDHAAPAAARNHLMTRIVVAGVTDVVTSWIDGTLVADRKTLVEAIVELGRAVGS